MMDQAKGAIQDGVGKAQEALGEAAGDVPTQVRGRVRQGAAKVQMSYGEAVSGLRDAATSNPITTMIVVAGVGFLLGVMWSRRD